MADERLVALAKMTSPEVAEAFGLELADTVVARSVEFLERFLDE